MKKGMGTDFAKMDWRGNASLEGLFGPFYFSDED